MDNNTLDYESALMARAAWYYYYCDMTQQDIAEKLGMTRLKVIKLLDKARASGMIQFKIRSVDERRMELEQALMEKYNLQDCFLVPAPQDEADVNENVAQAASMYIGGRVSDDTFINIGYGDTTGRVLNHLAQNTDFHLSFISLTGGVGYYLPSVDALGSQHKLYLIPTPLIASTKEIAEAITSEKSVNDVQQLIPLSKISVVGIGALDPAATIVQSGALSQSDQLFLEQSGAIGDILSHFFDRDGQLIETELESRTISTPLSTLAGLDNVIGVAAGKQKVDAIHAALLGNYLNVLISDEDTAEALLNIN